MIGVRYEKQFHKRISLGFNFDYGRYNTFPDDLNERSDTNPRFIGANRFDVLFTNFQEANTYTLQGNFTFHFLNNKRFKFGLYGAGGYLFSNSLKFSVTMVNYNILTYVVNFYENVVYHNNYDLFHFNAGFF